MTGKTCSIEGCPNVHHSLGWCRKHRDWIAKRHPDRYQARYDATVRGPQHGTRKRYSAGCRCALCKRVESEYRAAWRLRTGRTRSSSVLHPK